MKGATEVQNLRTAFAMTRRHVFAHLPIHRRLQAILDCQRAALDEKIMFQRPQTDDALEGFYKLRISLRINIRVGDFDFRRPKKIALHCGIIKVRMIKSNRHRAEKSVEINESFARDGVVQI